MGDLFSEVELRPAEAEATGSKLADTMIETIAPLSSYALFHADSIIFLPYRMRKIE
jgi:hypothetical protein